MSIALQLGIAVASVAVLIGVMAIVRRVATSLDWSAEVQRKLVHISTGLYALTLPWLFPDRWPVLVLIGAAIFVMLVLRLPMFAHGGLGETLHGVERNSYGDLLLALAIGVVFVLADEPVLYVLPLAILTLSDAAAALTGSTYGRSFFKVEDGRKSLEGSVMFLLVSFSLSMVCLLALSDTPRLNVIYLAAIVAAFGTLIEADSWRGFDNFFLPAGLMVFLKDHLLTPPMELFFIMAVFFLAIWSALILAPRLGMPRHLSRVYVTAAFLVLTVVGITDAVLPLVMLAAHYIAQRFNPDEAAFPELDCIAALALMSFFWLAFGRITGAFNLELYALTSLSMIVSFAVLAASKWRFITGAGAAVAGFLLYPMLIVRDDAPNTMHVDPLTLGATVVFALVVTALLAGWFSKSRALKVTALAMIAPLISFTLQYPTMAGGLFGGS